jgi:IS5 family transposase
MARSRYTQVTLADQLVGPGRSRSDRFFEVVDQAVDWGPIEEELSVIHKSRIGRPPIAPLLMFKVLLIQRFYNLSDPATEDALNDRKSFARFVGLPLDEPAPDYSSISRFRSALIALGLMEKLSQRLMTQIEAKDLVLKQGTLMDATFVVSAARPPSAPPRAKSLAKAKSTAKDEGAADESAAREESAAETARPAVQTTPADASDEDLFAAGKRSRVDPDARWAKKGRQAYFGYKLHIAVDDARRIVRTHKLTPANVSDCTVGPDLVQPDGGAHYADKGYPSQPLRDKLAEHGLSDGVMQLPTRHYPLSPASRRRNRLLARIRGFVEGVFGESKRVLGLARARYLGLAKVQLECDLVIFAFNLKTMALARPK